VSHLKVEKGEVPEYHVMNADCAIEGGSSASTFTLLQRDRLESKYREKAEPREGK
jgi:hypothetical protein